MNEHKNNGLVVTDSFVNQVQITNKFVTTNDNEVTNEFVTTNASENGVNRRDFLKCSALLGGSALALQAEMALGFLNRAEAGELSSAEVYELAKAENTLYTSCLQCNTGCGVKAKILNGVVVKIDGSPYSPWCMYPHQAYKSSPFDMAKMDGQLCPKGAAGIQTAYDPYRIRKVLKRAGKRGEMKWTSVSFEQAIQEITDGGKLFANVPGEEKREVEGFKSVWALRDKIAFKDMSGDVAKIKGGTMTVEEFKTKHAAHLDKLIDPNHPDFGPKNNQFTFMFGRVKGGRSDFIKRFVMDSFGSANYHGHTTVCQGSLYFTGKAMSEQYVYDEKDKKVKWTGGDKFYWQADVANAEFVLFVGAGVWEGGYGPTLRAPMITNAIAKGQQKIAVIDPRFSKLASKAWRWVPAKNGSEGAFALAMIQWVIANKKYNEKFLRAANKAAAAAIKETTWCNSTWVVKGEGKAKLDKNGKEVLDKDGKPVMEYKPGAFLYGSEIGLPRKKMTHTVSVEKPIVKADGTYELDEQGKPKLQKVNDPVKDDQGAEMTYEMDLPLVFVDGKLTPFDPNDGKEAMVGDLMGEQLISLKDKEGKELPCQLKTGFQLLVESCNKKTIPQWAEICGVEPKVIEELAAEFTSHGSKAVADIHRGVSQHTNGYYNVHAWYTLNLLVANFDHKGGLMKPTTYSFDGSKAGQPFAFGKLNPGKLGEFGISAIRHNIKFEESSLFDKAKGSKNYPAKRQWWPLSSDVYEEIVPSLGDQYPYANKILMLYMGAPTYALPGGHTNIEILSDTSKVPLFIANDITIGETSMYADYIFPDTGYLERWEFHGSHPTVAHKVQPVRQPIIAPIPEMTTVFGQEMPICLESMLMGVAEKLGMKGWGKNGFAEGQDLTHFDQFYLRAVANIASGDKPMVELDGNKTWLGGVSNADDKEMELFLKSRAHLPKNVFDPERWEASVGEDMWKKVVYTLNRGGRLDDFDKGYEGDMLKNRYAKQANFYCEKTAKCKNAITGKSYYGIAKYVPQSHLDGTPLDDESKGYDLLLMTYRDVAQTKSRTISNYYLNALRPENFILINEEDAGKRGIKDDDKVQIMSATNTEGVWDLKAAGKRPMTGKAKVTQGIRPGVVAFSLGHGHWAMGASDFTLDGKAVKGEAQRATGIHANAAMRLDNYLKNTCLFDPIGGSVSFYDTKVKVVKV